MVVMVSHSALSLKYLSTISTQVTIKVLKKSRELKLCTGEGDRSAGTSEN